MPLIPFHKPCTFLSTPPSRVATGVPSALYHVLFKFLSTPPSRVATATSGAVPLFVCCFYPRHPRGWRPLIHGAVGAGGRVSIHATLAGGDRPGIFFTFGMNSGFYPRHPRGWRPEIAQGALNGTLVSIHATLAGGDFKEINYGQAGGIVSIHATLAGGDTAIVGMFGENAGFYPRHPRGWRPFLPPKLAA